MTQLYNPQLATFLMVCETGSFNKAASRLYITPSAVLQQINALEKGLDVKLVTRTKAGISLTEAGMYMREAASEWVRRGDQICTETEAIAKKDSTLSIGTSVLEKCRLLYELWMLYFEQHAPVKFNMVPILTESSIPKEIDMIESINSQVPWMKEWNFLEICRVRFGFAVGRHHRLSSRKELSPGILRGETIVSFRGLEDPDILSMHREIKEYGGILELYDYPKNNLLWASAFEDKILLAPLCWEDILVNMTVIRCSWNYAVPYGIFYRKAPNKLLNEFLRFVRKTYQDGNAQDIVPVL